MRKPRESKTLEEARDAALWYLDNGHNATAVLSHLIAELKTDRPGTRGGPKTLAEAKELLRLYRDPTPQDIVWLLWEERDAKDPALVLISAQSKKAHQAEPDPAWLG